MNEISFEGMEEVIEVLDTLITPEKINRAITKACLLVERTAKQNASKFRGTGELVNSIQSKADGNTGIVFTNLFYAPYVEYGTGLFAENGNGRKDVPWVYYDLKNDEFVATNGREPTPFLRPAIDENRENIKKVVRKEILKKDDGLQ